MQGPEASIEVAAWEAPSRLILIHPDSSRTFDLYLSLQPSPLSPHTLQMQDTALALYIPASSNPSATLSTNSTEPPRIGPRVECLHVGCVWARKSAVGNQYVLSSAC